MVGTCHLTLPRHGTGAGVVLGIWGKGFGFDSLSHDLTSGLCLTYLER